MPFSTIGLFSWIEGGNRKLRWLMVPVISGLIAGVCLLVYFTGGIKYVFSHSMYLPILLSGLLFGVRGGTLSGLLGGIALGPFMPLDLLTGEMQHPLNWIYRTAIFALYGAFAGLVSDSVGRHVKRFHWIAHHDEATGLSNLSALGDDLKRLSAKETSPALALLAVENISELKGAFGPQVTHAVIRQLADRSRQTLSGLKQVYRTDIQELSLLFSGKGREDLDAELRKLPRLYLQPFFFRDIPLHCDIRIAVVPVENRCTSAETCLQLAESALLRARQENQDLVTCDERQIEDTICLLGELKEALKAGQLHVHYQPLVSTRDGRVELVEALIRWHHPQRGDIPPGKFIPRAEKSTLIHQLTHYVLDSSLAQAARWHESGIDLTVAVNISAKNLADPNFTDSVLALLEKHRVPGRRLVLEITEGNFLFDIKHCIGELKRLAEAEILIAIDDFGTGYSSLAYLHELPVSVVKIDQSFVFDLPKDKKAASIVGMAQGLTRRLGIRAVAEGVENRDALDFLVSRDVDLLQGYLIARPMAAEDLTRWYRSLPEPGIWHLVD